MAARALGKAVGVAILLAAASNCSTSPSVPITLVHPSSPSSQFFSFPSAFQFSLGDTPAQQLVISDTASWNSLWSRLVSGHSPVPDAPVIDFSQDILLLTTMGAEPTSGYATSIQSATENGGGPVVVDITETSPSSSCVVLDSITHPVDAVTVPRALALRIQFHVTKSVHNCGS